jgi:hypothetical protein
MYDVHNYIYLYMYIFSLDIAEIRTMQNPPAAVEIVLEAVMIILTGKVMMMLFS